MIFISKKINNFLFLTLTAFNFSAHAAAGTTIGDLQSATSFDQIGFDTAIRATGGEMDLNYKGALAGTLPTLTQSAAVILQGSDTSFGFIEQVSTLATDFNYAVIDQTTANNNAYIVQSGLENYASIVQSGLAPTVAYISQLGNTNRAIINQK
ncbi:MAG: hypothetical protein JZU60_00845 [Ilumatobacteraceae bacterium]|jgi:hypothetical protein|nr:hypothetical protein [Ilumatobacteraceae bacterium]